MKPLLVLDIDETLACTQHRSHLLKRHCVACGSSDVVNYWGSDQCVNCSCDTFTIPALAWQAFNNPNNVARDEPFKKAQDFLNKYNFRFDKAVITGRQENLRKVTSDWLYKHYGFGNDIPLLMRPSHSFYDYTAEGAMPASKYKEQQLQKLISGNDPPLIILLDDDPYVLHVYSKYGIALRAPDCWNFLCHSVPSLQETVFSK